MNNRQKNNYLAYYISAITIVVFFGCSVEQTHKTLVFFFDGVPPLHSLLAKADSAKNNNNSALAKANARKQPANYFHKPYLERKCEECHTPDRHLLMPQPDLCYKCHTNFAETYKYVHGPVASGNCTKCHNQHNSQYPKLLIRPGQQLCLYCHGSSLVYNNKFHRKIEDAECTLCHNPHGGKTRFMIKDAVARDFNGLAALNDVASKHFFAQVYCNTPGDIKAGTEIITQANDENFEIISTDLVDVRGQFSIAKIETNENYTFKTKADLPEDAKVVITDYKDQVLYVIDKNKKGKFIFDKTDFASSYAIAKAKQRNDSLAEKGLNPEAVPPTREEKIAANVQLDKKIQDSLLPDATTGKQDETPVTGKATETAGAAGKETNENRAPATDSTSSVAKAADSGPGNEQDANQPAKAPATSDVKATGKEITGGQATAAPNENDLFIVKLAGHTYQLAKGTTVGIENESGDIVALASVDNKGNFVVDKLSNYSSKGNETGNYAKMVRLYYNMAATNKNKFQGFTELGTIQATRAKGIYVAPFSVGYYDYNKHNLNADALAELNKVAVYLKKNPDMNACLAAHADARGSDRYNLRLSEKRAKAARDYLIRQGIGPQRITTIGEGKTKLKNKCSGGMPCSEEEHRQNRRVEVSVTVK